MNKIYVWPEGGLCNRMRVIASAYKLSKELGNGIEVIWCQNKDLNASFSDLFESLPFPLTNVKVGSLWQKVLWLKYTRIKKCMLLDNEWINKHARKKVSHLWVRMIERKDLFMHSSSDILFEEGYYKVFKIREDILPQYAKTFSTLGAYGIHIRRTDNKMAMKYSPTSLFIKKIEDLLLTNPDAKFFLATDDPSEEELFLNKFGNSIITYKKRSLDRNDPHAIQDAVIDLWFLAHCKKIYGSYYSSFSDVAALWGGIEKEIMTVKLPPKN